MERLRVLLIENLARLPLTDLYLLYPLLENPECRRELERLVVEFLEERDLDEICELVNSASLYLLTYEIVGGTPPSTRERVSSWILSQKLSDGGWSWLPKERAEKGEAWCTALVLAALKASRVNADYEGIVEFLERNWEEEEWGDNPEVALIYLSYAGYRRDSSLVLRPVERLLGEQLENGAWPGYSDRTRRGGIFRTCVVLNALASLGFSMEEEAVSKALEFVRSRVGKLLRAEWGGVLVHALASLASALLRLGVEE